MRCDIIMPVWDNLDVTRECVEAIGRNTRYPHRMIIIDNASSVETKDYLEDLKKMSPADVILIRNEENLGFVKAMNQGLDASDAPYVCVFNNDTLPAPGWLENMIDFCERHPDVGLINPQCDGHGKRSIDEHAKYLGAFKGRYMEMNQCQGFCMLMRREMIEKIGLLDEAFGVGGYDDTDYSMRAHMAGYKSVAVKDAYVYHRLHASFDKAGNREEWVRRNRAIYYKKWGRHLRMAVAVSMKRFDHAAVSRLMKLAYGLAREWTWVHVLINSGIDKDDMKGRINEILKEACLPPHQNIRVNHFNMPRIFFSMVLAGKMLERLRRRMRDKRFDAVVSFDNAVALPVPFCARMMGASIVKVSSAADIGDWEKKGREIALYIKNKSVEMHGN